MPTQSEFVPPILRMCARASVLSALIVGRAFAGDWPLEPTSALGFELGAAIPATMPRCKSAVVRAGDDICVDDTKSPYSDQFRRIDGLPFPDIRITGSLALHRGVVAAVYLEIHHGDYGKFRRVLVERYGEPSTTTASTVRNNSGAELASQTDSWEGKLVSIRYVERKGRLDRSVVTISHLPTVRDVAKESDKAVKDAASKL